MKQIICLSIILSCLVCPSSIYAQPKYKYLNTTQGVGGFAPENTYATSDGYLLSGTKGYFFRKKYLVSIDDNMKIVDKKKIPKKIGDLKLDPLGIYKMGNNYAVLYQYYKKKELHFGYDLYHPAGGYFDGNFREITSTKVKRRNRDYYEPFVYQNEESGSSMLLLNHKNIKLRYFVVVYWVETKDVKQEMFLFNDKMKILQKDKRFKLRGTGDNELRGTYDLTDFEVDPNNNIFILGSKKPSEPKGRKARKKLRKSTQKTELGLFLRTADGTMSGQPIPLDVEVKSIDLAKKGEQITSMGTYITDPKKRNSQYSEGIFRVNLEFDEDLEDLTLSDPEYFPFSKEFAEAFDKNYDIKEKKRRSRRSRPETQKKKKRLLNLEAGHSEEGGDASSDNFVKASMTDIKFMDDGSTVALLEEQYVRVVTTTTTTTDGNGMTTTRTTTTYYYHYNNLGVLKIDPEGELSYAILPKQSVLINQEKEKGYEVFDYGNSLAVVQHGKIHEVNLEDMSVSSKDIKQWKIKGNISSMTQKDGYNFFILNAYKGWFKKMNLLEVISLSPPR